MGYMHAASHLMTFTIRHFCLLCQGTLNIALELGALQQIYYYLRLKITYNNTQILYLSRVNLLLIKIKTYILLIYKIKFFFELTFVLIFYIFNI